MPQKYISALEGVGFMIDWVRANSTIVGVFFMTLFAAILRSHKDGKVDFIEAVYCALIAVGLSTALVAVLRAVLTSDVNLTNLTAGSTDFHITLEGMF